MNGEAPAEKPISHRRLIVARLFGAFAVFFAGLWLLANGWVALQVVAGVYEGPEGLFAALFLTAPPVLFCAVVDFSLRGFRRARLAWISVLLYGLPMVLAVAAILFETVLSVFR